MSQRRNTQRTGRLDLVLGPMVSGKTSLTVYHLTRFADIGYRVGYINHAGDVRKTSGGDGERFTSHSSTLQQISPKIACYRASELGEVDVVGLDVVGVDEAHFFADLYDRVVHWVEAHHKHVIVCGLDGSYLRRPIGDILRLIPLAETVKKASSQCGRCIAECRASTVDFAASFTIRKTSDTDPLVPGGLDEYEPVCRYHWLDHTAMVLLSLAANSFDHWPAGAVLGADQVVAIIAECGLDQLEAGLKAPSQARIRLLKKIARHACRVDNAGLTSADVT